MRGDAGAGRRREAARRRRRRGRPAGAGAAAPSGARRRAQASCWRRTAALPPGPAGLFRLDGALGAAQDGATGTSRLRGRGKPGGSTQDSGGTSP